MTRLIRFVILGAIFVAAMAGCSTSQPPLVALANGCNSLASAYIIAAGYETQHKLSASAVATLTALEPAALAACNKNNPPSDPVSALSSVQAWLNQWALINAGLQKVN